MSQLVSDKIIAKIYSNGRGHVFTAKDFSHIANAASVRTTLTRLTQKGTIRRLMRGIYEYPEYNQFINDFVNPSVNKVATAIARAHGWTIQPEGNAALNLLGLSTQVPAKWEYLSDGPSKCFSWAGGNVSFKHRTNKEITPLSSSTALLVQALKALGKDNVTDEMVERIGARLRKTDIQLALRESRYATSWVYEMIKRLSARKEFNNA
jgi:hypothetical protein